MFSSQKMMFIAVLFVSVLSMAGICSAEFQVNTYTTDNQQSPAVAMDEAGNFVVVWESYWQDGDWRGVYGQRFNANGKVIGGEFQVNTATSGNQKDPTVAMDAAGNFAVAWSTDGEIHARRYNSNGTPVTAPFLVNTAFHNRQLRPSISINNSGDFVVSWLTIDSNPNHTAD